MMKHIMIIIVFFIWQCDSEVETSIKIKVYDNNRVVIANADVFLNGKKLGVTNRRGEFKGQMSLVSDRNYQLKVSKESSERFYYAPFFQEVSIDEQNNIKEEFKVVLYSVPKLKFAKNSSEDFTSYKNKKGDPKTEKANLVASTQPYLKDYIELPDLSEQSNFPVFEMQKKIKNKKVIHNIYVFSGKKPLSNVQIYLSNRRGNSLDYWGKTDLKGRISVKLSDNLIFYHMVALKENYYTESKKINLNNKNITRVFLKRGKSLNVFALQKKHGVTSGVEGVKIYKNDVFLGETNNLGILHSKVVNHNNKLSSLRLKSDLLSPKVYSVDYSNSVGATLVRLYSPSKKKRNLKVEFLAPRYSREWKNIYENKTKLVEANFLNNLKDTLVMNKVITLEEEGAKAHRLPKDNNNKESSYQVRVVFTEIGKKLYSEILLYDSYHKIIAASILPINVFNNKKNLLSKVHRMIMQIPMEGLISNTMGRYLTLDLGVHDLPHLVKGDQFQVYGLKSDMKGQLKESKVVGLATITSTSRDNSTAVIESLDSLSIVSKGDKVVYQPKNMISGFKKSSKIILTDKETKKQIAGARLYNSRYDILAVSDHQGVMNFQKRPNMDQLLIVKEGYISNLIRYDHRSEVPLLWQIKKSHKYMKIHNQDELSKMAIDGLYLPLREVSEISVPNRNFQIKVQGLNQASYYKKIIKKEEIEAIDKREPISVALYKNRLVNIEKTKIQNIDSLLQIKSNSPDYLESRKRAVSLFVKNHQDYEKAIELLKEIRKSKKGDSLITSRLNFNLGLLYYIRAMSQKAKTINENMFELLVHAVSSFEESERFVRNNNEKELLKNVTYYLALTHYQLWKIKKEANYFKSSLRSLKSYEKIKINTNMSSKDDKINHIIKNISGYKMKKIKI